MVHVSHMVMESRMSESFSLVILENLLNRVITRIPDYGPKRIANLQNSKQARLTRDASEKGPFENGMSWSCRMMGNVARLQLMLMWHHTQLMLMWYDLQLMVMWHHTIALIVPSSPMLCDNLKLELHFMAQG